MARPDKASAGVAHGLTYQDDNSVAAAARPHPTHHDHQLGTHGTHPQWQLNAW